MYSIQIRQPPFILTKVRGDTMETTYLELINVSKSFPGARVLTDINISVTAGQVVSIVGENGAGKSTLGNIISGSLKPDSGTIRFLGEYYTHLTIEKAKELGISMVHQELMVLPKMTASANIFVGNELHNGTFLKTKDMDERAAELMAMVGLNMPADTLVSDIDIAGRQMLEIARAINLKSKIIILDEPTSSLSDTETEKLFNVVNELKREGVSFIFVSHRLNEVLTISDVIYVLKDGELVTKLDPKTSTEDDIVRNMVGRNYDDYYNRKRTYFGEEVFSVEHLSGTESYQLARNAYTPQDITFSLHEGEVLGIAGLVGAGRTELIRLIFGEDKKTPESKIYLNRELIHIDCCKDAIDKGMAWVTEDRKTEGLILPFSIKENVVLPSLNSLVQFIFVDKQKEDALPQEYVEKLNIKATGVDQDVRHLSGGNQQKVVLAKWLAKNPKVLFLDEPTRGIDIGAKAEVYKLINELTSEGMAVVVISSELPEVIGISDRILVMHDGKIAGELQRRDFSEENVMKLAAGGKISV